MRLSLIGVGKQGQKYLKAATELETQGSVKVVALCDPKIDKNIINGNARVYSDYQEMLKREQPDGVIIVTPNILHNKICQDALNSGCHVLKEKPFAMNIKEAEQMMTCAKKNNKILKIAQQRWFNQLLPIVKNWLNFIGDIKIFNYKFTLSDLSFSWYKRKDQGGGCWLGLGWHGLWCTTYLLGKPDFIKATFFQDDNSKLSNVECTALANIYYSKFRKFSGTIYVSTSSLEKTEKIDIFGSKGSIQYAKSKAQLFDISRNVISCINRNSENDLYQLQLATFLKECLGEIKASSEYSNINLETMLSMSNLEIINHEDRQTDQKILFFSKNSTSDMKQHDDLYGMIN